jgi:hypothetical protein
LWPAGGTVELQTLLQGDANGANAWQSIWGIDDNNIWVVGTSIQRWNGSSLSIVQANNGLDAFMAVWASSPTNVWVVGQGGIIYHGDGTNFAPVTSPTISDLLAVWGSGPNDIWAAGASGTFLHYGP